MSNPPLSKYQQFTYEELPRTEIELAHYNPRKITEGNRKRLSKALTDHGLVEPLVWNRRTGRLVSGHQRITDLDVKHHGTNYSIGLAVIDVDEKTEVKLNVMLNNPSMQGVFDIDAVSGIGQSFKIDLGDFGFSREDLLIDFGIELKAPAPELPRTSSAPTPSFSGEGSPGGIIGPGDELPGEPSAPPVTPEQALMNAKFASRREAGYEASAGGQFMTNEDDSRIQVVFDDAKKKTAFLEALGLPTDALTIPAETFLELVKGRIVEGSL